MPHGMRATPRIAYRKQLRRNAAHERAYLPHRSGVGCLEVPGLPFNAGITSHLDTKRLHRETSGGVQSSADSLVPVRGRNAAASASPGQAIRPTPQPSCGYLPSFADAKARKDVRKQIFGRERSRDLTERVLRFAELFGDELARAGPPSAEPAPGRARPGPASMRPSDGDVP